MKNRHPIIAVVLLFVAIFFALGNDGGALGSHLASLAVRGFGQTGVAIFVAALIFTAYLLGAPAGTATKIVRSIRVRRAAPRMVPATARIEAVITPVLPAEDRRKADSVRTAMKSLGYLKHEYDPVVAGLDLKLPLEALVRQSLKTLHAQKVLS